MGRDRSDDVDVKLRLSLLAILLKIMNKKILQLLQKLISLYRQLLVLKRPIKYMIIHHTATSRDYTKYKTINENHRKRWKGKSKSQLGQYCGYQYFINGKGETIQARRDTELGWHTRGHNRKTVGICLTGSFGHEKPSTGQLNALEGLLYEKIREYKLDKSRIKGHRDFRPTACPGDSLYKWIQDFKGRL